MRSREGVVLVAALLALLALEAAAIGLLFVVTQETIVVRAHERALRGRLAAEDAAIEAARSIAQRAAGGSPDFAVVASAEPSGGPVAGVGLRALNVGPWIALHAASHLADGAAGRASLLLEHPDPLRFLPVFEPPPDSADTSGALDELALLATKTAEGALVLRPAAHDDHCIVDIAHNWGAPGESGHPCSAFVPVILVPDAARIDGGRGQAILVVAGELTVGAGAALDAAVLVIGRLVIEEGAVVRGAVSVAPAAQFDGTAEYDPSLLRTLLAASSPLRIPHPARRHWLPAPAR